MFILVSEYQITCGKKIFPGQLSNQFYEFSDEVMFSHNVFRLAPTTKIKPFLDSMKKELSKNVGHTMVGCILFKLCHCKCTKPYLLEILGMSRLWHDLMAHGHIWKSIYFFILYFFPNKLKRKFLNQFLKKSLQITKNRLFMMSLIFPCCLVQCPVVCLFFRWMNIWLTSVCARALSAYRPN